MTTPIIDTGRVVILSDIGSPVIVNIGPPGTPIPGGAGAWGAITGTLSDQTDLQAALDGKEDAGTAASAVSTHAGATDPHGDRAYADGLAGNYATAAQGAKADTAVQPAAIATKLDDLSAGTADAIVTASADGTLLSRAAYTIATLLAAARDRATHTGTQLASTISDFTAAVQALFGTSSGTICEGDDSRLSDARTPTSHAASHQSGGADAIKLDDLAAPDDNTDLNATTSAHGLLPKLGGGTSNFLRADGSWSAPPGGTPGGSSGQLQYNNAGAFGGIAGSSWASNQLLITAQAAATTPLAVKAAASHSANIQEWQNSAGTALATVTAGGGMYAAEYMGISGFANSGMGDSSGPTLFRSGTGVLTIRATNQAQLASNVRLSWTSGASFAAEDATLLRVAAGIVGVRAVTAGGALSFIEQTAPSAPATNGVYIYAEDNGSGKTRLMARFATGAAQQIAIEP